MQSLIHSESNFNLERLHFISPFRDHMYKFGNIPMYSPEYQEVTHKEETKIDCDAQIQSTQYDRYTPAMVDNRR